VRYALALGPADVGARVVVRAALEGGGATDLLGELVRWDDEAVEVRRSGGQVVAVARSAVLAGKRVPPAPVRRP
jgi:N-acetylglutamate synthase